MEWGFYRVRLAACTTHGLISRLVKVDLVPWVSVDRALLLGGLCDMGYECAVYSVTEWSSVPIFNNVIMSAEEGVASDISYENSRVVS